jgi:transposase
MNKLVVGIDPHKDSLGVCISHPDRDEIISGFSIKNCSALEAKHLIAKAYKLAYGLGTKPVFVIESTNVFWRPILSFLKGRGLEVETVNSYQTKNLRKTLMRKTKTDTIDAKLICDLYKQGKSHQTHFAPEPLFSLRELTRLYKFLVDIKAMALNRINGYLLQIFPELESILPKSLREYLALLMRTRAYPSTSNY